MPQWMLVVLGLLIPLVGVGVYHFLTQGDKVSAIWAGLITWCLLGIFIAIAWRNDVIAEQETVRTDAAQQGKLDEFPEPTGAKSESAPGRDGLTFKEVPPEKLGVPIPDTFEVDFGNNIGIFSRKILEQQVPFYRLTGIKFGGDIPLRIFFDEEGELKVDATVYDRTKREAAIIKASDFAVLNARWDRNWDRIGFEIVDENNIPFFQIERPRENLIRIRGVFVTSQGEVIVSTDSGLFGNPTRPVPAPRAIFMYPSSKNLGKRTSGN